jgi:hypothetical protein
MKVMIPLSSEKARELAACDAEEGPQGSVLNHALKQEREERFWHMK